jgi:nicotinamide-nucleotide amidase
LQRGEVVSTAESCTGGQIVSTLTNVSGSSAILHQGYVTYSNEAKTEILGVPADLIEKHGAVSEEVVRAMAEGCLRVSGADHAIAVSGVAGPTGGTEEKPVGTVYIGIAGKGFETYAKRHFTPADRISFKLRVTRLALDLLRRRLCGFVLEK